MPSWGHRDVIFDLSPDGSDDQFCGSHPRGTVVPWLAGRDGFEVLRMGTNPQAPELVGNLIEITAPALDAEFRARFLPGPDEHARIAKRMWEAWNADRKRVRPEPRGDYYVSVLPGGREVIFGGQEGSYKWDFIYVLAKPFLLARAQPEPPNTVSVEKCRAKLKYGCRGRPMHQVTFKDRAVLDLVHDEIRARGIELDYRPHLREQ